MITMCFSDSKQYREARGFAEDVMAEESFNAAFTRILQIAANYDRSDDLTHCSVKVNIGKDWAKWSFAFAIFVDDELAFNGGIIYHGIDQDEGNGSITLVRSKADHRWQIHS